MKLSLYHRLAVSLCLIFFVIAGAVLIWWQIVDKTVQQEAEQRLHLSLAANLIHDNPLLQQGVYDYQALENLFHTSMILGPAFEFYLLDRAGKVLTHGASKPLARQSIDLTPIKNLTQNRAALPIFGDDPRHADRQKIFSAAPIFKGHELHSYLYVIIGGEAHDSVLSKTKYSSRFEMSIVVFVAAISLLLIITLALFRSVTNPLRRLMRDVKLMQNNTGAKPLAVFSTWQKNSHNEVSQLGCVFNDMAQTINNQLEQLQQTDKQRRELLAHISHDLRTPLASLQGYLETIALSQGMTEQQLKQHISTALNNTKQLKHLIDQIFELAYLDSGQVSLILENFSVNELVYDIAAKFAIRAEQKGLSIDINCHEDNIYVHSDIAKLERIVSNLMENAIRHTNDGGRITLSLQHSPNQCVLTITDTGTGIASNELSYIFDERYRGNNAIDDQQAHAGLGLTICKRLSLLLNTEIEVHSVLGEGTSFSLLLRPVNA